MNNFLHRQVQSAGYLLTGELTISAGNFKIPCTNEDQATFLASTSRTAGINSFGTSMKVWDVSSQAINLPDKMQARS
jgi:hypothetical protein